MRELNLTSLRGALTQDRPATTERMRVRPPKLALLPKAPPPGGGLFLSAIIHTAAIFGLLAGLPYLFPGRRVIVVNIPEDWLRDPNHEVLYMPKLPRIERAGSPSDVKGEPSKKALTLAKLEAKSGDAASERPKSLVVGPQVIVSDLPDSTNDVQTIRRPDLINPPKFPKPILLPSMVMLPAHARKVAITPPIDQPVQPAMPNPQDLPTFRASVPHLHVPVSPMKAPKAAPIQQVDSMQPVVSNPQQLMTFRDSQPHVQVPVLPMGVPRQSSVVPAEAAVPRIANAADRSLPEFASSGPSAPQAVVVINAFGVPSQASPAIPNAELSGSFVVGPVSGANGSQGGSAVTGGSVAGAGTGTGATPGTGSGAGTGSRKCQWDKREWSRTKWQQGWDGADWFHNSYGRAARGWRWRGDSCRIRKWKHAGNLDRGRHCGPQRRSCGHHRRNFASPLRDYGYFRWNERRRQPGFGRILPRGNCLYGLHPYERCGWRSRLAYRVRARRLYVGG